MAFMILTHMNIDTKHQENLKLNNPNLFSLKKDKDSSNCRELKKKKQSSEVGVWSDPIPQLEFKLSFVMLWKIYRNILNVGFLVKDKQGSLKT